MFEIELIICIKMKLALNDLQRLICHTTQPTNQPLKFVVSKNNKRATLKTSHSTSWRSFLQTVVFEPLWSREAGTLDTSIAKDPPAYVQKKIPNLLT